LLLLLLFQSKDYLHEPDMFLLQCWMSAAATTAPAAALVTGAATAAAAPLPAAGVRPSHPSGGVAAAVAVMLAAFGGLPLMQAAGARGVCSCCTSSTSHPEMY
jgi:hypothetical protein